MMLVMLAALAFAQESPNLVLITMDTTRMDAIGAYDTVTPGLITPRTGVTPNIDAIAAQGVRFEHFFAHAPTTLSSHTSLFTGLDPHQHAVPKNGYPIAEGMDTLALRLQREGYDTIGIVAAAALESEMGLARGFDVYDERMSHKHGPMYQDTAEGVLRRTVVALNDRSGDAPLFLWVHFYDAHGPYSAPGDWFAQFQDADYDGPYADPDAAVELRPTLRDGRADPADVDQIAARYLGEVHYMDHHIGLLMDDLRTRGLLDKAVVVLTSDHGETMSEYPRHAWGHGADVDDGVLHIPLIIQGAGVVQGAVVSTQADMSGLASTIEGLVGLEPVLSPERSFQRLVAPGPVWDEDGWPSRPTRVSYGEATRVKNPPETGWNNALLPRSVRVPHFFLKNTPRDSSWVWQVSPGAPTNGDHARSLLHDLLYSWDLLSPAHRDRQMSDDTVDALRALGYIDSPSEDPGDDPNPPPP